MDDETRSWFDQALAEARGDNWSDYEDALRHTVVNMAKDGITAVRYVTKDGRVINTPTDVAVRRAIRTEITQGINNQTLSNLNYLGINFVQVSSCMCARPSHAVWQGKVYQLSGSDKYPNYYAACNVGDMVNGIGGYNCDHTVSSYFEGDKLRLSTLNPLAGTGYTQEQARTLISQQRWLENMIRKVKRQIEVAKELGIEKDKAKGMLRAYRRELEDLIAEHAILTFEPERINIYSRSFLVQGLSYIARR